MCITFRLDKICVFKANAQSELDLGWMLADVRITRISAMEDKPCYHGRVAHATSIRDTAVASAQRV